MSSVLWSDNEKRQRRIWRRLVKSKGSRGRGRQRVIILGDLRLWHDGILSIQLIEITKERDLEKDEAVASYGKTRDGVGGAIGQMVYYAALDQLTGPEMFSHDIILALPSINTSAEQPSCMHSVSA